MKILGLTIAFSLFLFIGTAFGQLKSMVNAPEDTSTQISTALTADLFYDLTPQFNFYSFATPLELKQEPLPIFDNKITQVSLVLGRSILANKNDLKSTHTFSPLTVSDYSRQVRQQFFMPEPTSQQRRSLPLFNW